MSKVLKFFKRKGVKEKKEQRQTLKRGLDAPLIPALFPVLIGTTF